MAERQMAAKHPMVLELQPGTYHWCQCGRSANQPYCDGSHAGTGLAPITFTLEEPKRVALCLCKATGNEPFCDGAHKRL